MKPLTVYSKRGMKFDGYWYAKDEADALIRHWQDAALCAEEAALSHAQKIAELEAERDAALAECERMQADAERAVRFSRWLVAGDTGLSSESIAMHMLGWACRGRYPVDPSDLGRCLRLLEKFPEWQDRIGEMAAYGPEWAEIARRWPELSALMAGEVGIRWEKGRSAPITYATMQAAIDAAHKEGG